MYHLFRRAAVTTGATVAIVALTAGSASAHFCFKRDLNPQAAAKIGDSQGFAPLSELITMFTGVSCDGGVAFLAGALGATPTTLINVKGTMAGGNVKQGKENPAIAHLEFPETDEEFEALIGEAMVLCAPPEPGV